MDPGEMPVSPGEKIQLSLLTVPEDGQGQKAHQVSVELGKQRQKGVQKIPLAMDEFVRRVTKIQDKKSHCHRKNAIANGRQALNTVTGDLIISSFLRLILGCAHLLNPSYFRDLFNKIPRQPGQALSARLLPAKRRFNLLV